MFWRGNLLSLYVERLIINLFCGFFFKIDFVEIQFVIIVSFTLLGSSEASYDYSE